MANKIIVRGRLTDNQTRCIHYHGPLDIIAIKFNCCNHYYPCYYCHQQEAGHIATVWNKTAFGEKAILCGACSNEMSITEYKESNYQCPFCNAAFNPKCNNHDHLYFDS